MEIDDIQSIEELYNYYKQNTYTITKEDAEKLLAKSLTLEIHEWNNSAHKYEPSKEKIILQENLIRASVDRGANLTHIFGRLSGIKIELLSFQQPLLLTEETATTFLKQTLLCSIQEWNHNTEKMELRQDKVTMQRKLINDAISKGANLTEALERLYGVEMNLLVAQQDVLVTQESSNIFLKHTLRCSVRDYKISPDTVTMQRQLIDYAISKGASLKKSITGRYTIDLDILDIHKDVLLTQETAYGFLETTAIFYINNYNCAPNNQKAKLHQQAKLMKAAIEMGADINQLIHEKSFHVHLSDMQVYKELLNSIPSFSPEAFLSVVLRKLSNIDLIIKNNSTLRKYARERVEAKKDLVSFAIEKGANIGEMSLNDLDIRELSIDILEILLEHGMDPQILIMHNLDMEDSLEVLKLAKEKGAKIPHFHAVAAISSHDIDDNIVQFFLINTTFSVNQKLSAHDFINEFISLGSKFKEHAEYEMQKLPNIISILEEIFAFKGTIAHVLARNGKLSALQFLLDNYQLDLNALNSKGQTPLFFAKNPEVSEFLINHGADSSMADENGIMWNESTYLVGNFSHVEYNDEL